MSIVDDSAPDEEMRGGRIELSDPNKYRASWRYREGGGARPSYPTIVTITVPENRVLKWLFKKLLYWHISMIIRKHRKVFDALA
jgi:hypothetical protein